MVAVAGAAVSAGPASAAQAQDVTCADQILMGGTYHDVTVAKGHWCMVFVSTVTGDIRSMGATTFGLAGSAVGGDVTVTGTTSYPNKAALPGLGTANGICSSVIHGSVVVTGSGPDAPWNISSTNYPPFANFSNCLAQIHVERNVTFDDNLGGPNAIAGANIDGDLECHGNAPFTDGVLIPFMKNGVAGTSSGQCAGLAVKGENPDIVPGPPAFLPVLDRGPAPRTPATAPPGTSVPRLSRLSLTNKVFAPAGTSTRPTATTARHRRRGTQFSFRLDQSAVVTIEIRLVCTTSQARRGATGCGRSRTVASLTRIARTGHNRVAFTGRVNGRALPAGRYRASFVATDDVGSSRPQRLAFTIVRSTA